MNNKFRSNKPIDPAILAASDHHNRRPEAILEVLTDLQDEFGAITPPIVTDIARALQIPAERAYGVASFYSLINLSHTAAPPEKTIPIRVCDGPVCWLKGAQALRQALDAATRANTAFRLERTSCLGLCDRAPAALVGDEQAGPLDPLQAADILAGMRGIATDYSTPRPGEIRVMMAKAGIIDPDQLDSALEHGAYCGLSQILSRDPESILAEVEASGLTGRGGAGFPVGRKWRFVKAAAKTPKFIICNADESEPLIFKDRALMDTNPHQILEGMAIAGYACGANTGYIYIRGEYTGQARRLENAIAQAEAAGWLGDNIQGSTFSFHIHVHRGAGAYICGEETALIESLEGKRGEPRNRPPYPPTAGFNNFPTLVNNVESYAAVPSIICNGAEWYRSLSGYTTPGTKMYMLLGHVCNPGLFEAPFGLTLSQLIEEYGGGMLPGSQFHFALCGGAAGTISGPGLLDIPIDYASAPKGISLGAGSFLICDQTVSPVAMTRELLHFFKSESCGKCTPCRIGTVQAHEILIRLAEKRGLAGDVDTLLNLVQVMQVTSFCGLGQSVIIPVKSAFQQFETDFLAGIQPIRA
jgi:NADH:ubiquinone oxidoreductase subunit F (NADH-binding)/NADH:ubiquinone oxidoreductase subunit E